jgi:hypothetical protein
MPDIFGCVDVKNTKTIYPILRLNSGEMNVLAAAFFQTFAI